MLTAGVGSVALGGGFRIGAAVSVSQKIGDWTLMANGSMFGGGAGNNLKNTLSGGFAYDDGKRGFSYMFNRYNYSNEPGGKQRTAALEVGYKGYSAGFNIYTTDAGKKNYQPDPSGKNPTGIHIDGHQLASVAYIGISNGRTMTRIGLNHPKEGWIQNGMHRASIMGRRLMESGDFQYGNYNSPYVNKGNSINNSSLYTY